MNDDDITKLASKLTESLATKEDLKNFATKDDLKSLEQNLTAEIQSVGKVLSDFIDEIDPKVENHEKRLKKIEALPSIAHQIK